MLVPKELQNVAQVLHNNSHCIIIVAIVLSTNMATVTSAAIKKNWTCVSYVQKCLKRGLSLKNLTQRPIRFTHKLPFKVIMYEAQ